MEAVTNMSARIENLKGTGLSQKQLDKMKPPWLKNEIECDC